jgi:predicted RNA-binding Zn-ribbon protein involved in translation (DUF1610 family)
MGWDRESLWQKAKLYMERALDENREGPMFPFWATLALELLGRAALANVHPALLADPKEGDNIMYAFGFTISSEPKSIPAKTVFTRCTKVAPQFTAAEFKVCMALIGRRNEELHTGTLAFEEFPTKLWLADFYRISQILLTSLGFSLKDFVGATEAKAATTMIQGAEKRAVERVRKAIGEAKAHFTRLDEQEQIARRAAGHTAACRPRGLTRVHACPACGTPAVIRGEQVAVTEPKLEGDMIVVETRVLPTEFECLACGLVLRDHESLHAAEMGGQFTVTEYSDPAEYYGVELDPADLYEEEYAND